mmetsp:Transcript_46680/g.98093  ORF Transcript_46680/g.98093 Transcript_46680/m.98093 type:complete len:511 (-) Transcript_46680:248-1780(-)
MPNNKKKSKQKKKGGGAAASASSDGDPNLNGQVLEALTRLADTIAHLEVASNNDAVTGDTTATDAAGEVSDLAKETASLKLNDADDAAEATTSSASPTSDASPAPSKSTLTPPALPISHWRKLPLQAVSAYKILNDGAEYIHATSTKYTLVGKVDSKEGGNLAVELRKGAELIGTGTLLFFSQPCGSSRSLRHYVKQSSRAVLASVISLVQSFEDGVSQGKARDGNNIGAQKTGAVWSACESMMRNLPKGNRTAMRRELMLWVRDCKESIEEFEEILSLGPLDDGGADGEDAEDAMMDEEQYREKEMKMAKVSVNVMKCSKNLLGMVLKTCECVGEHADKLSSEGDVGDASSSQTEQQSDSAQTGQKKKPTKEKQKEMLQWISNLHEMARTVGEGVTNFGILLYPPLDSSNNHEEFEKWQAKKSATFFADECSIPSLGSTTLGLQLEHQLYALSECVMSVHNATLTTSGESIQNCLSKEVTEEVARLTKAIKVRCNEVEEAIGLWDPKDG